MSTLRTIALGCVVLVALILDAAREARMQRRLGRNYEGPLDNAET